MVHYSSNLVCHEGGAKNPLKGTSMKFLVNARYAQFCVFSGSKDNRVKYNGIYCTPSYRGGLNCYNINLVNLSITYTKCQDTKYRVACLEW